MQQVVKDRVVTVDYQVSDAQGEIIQDSTQQPMVYLHGGYGEVFEAFEQALEGKCIGEEVWVQIEPEDAFGEYDAQLTRIEDRALFPDILEVGMQFEGTFAESEGEAMEHEEQDNEDNEPVIWTVTDMTQDKVILDGNHPLAGLALRYHLVVSDIRFATPTEIERGFVHETEPVVQVASRLH